MALIQLSTFIGLVCLVAADVSEIVGQNQYLPPNKGGGGGGSSGYNYDRPNVPFPSPSVRPSSQAPAPRPTASAPAPRPTASAPTPGPSYIPPATRPASPRPQTGGGGGYQLGPASSGSNPVVAHGGSGGHDHHHEPGMPYDFEYQVKDDYFGTDYSRNEVSDGDIIRGEYRVQLPDGRLQIVKYTADWKNGYNADVTYEGEPKYPEATGSGSAPYPAAGKPSSSYGPPGSAGY